MRVNSWGELEKLISELAPGMPVYWGVGGYSENPHVLVRAWYCPGDFSRGYAYVSFPDKVIYVEVNWPIQ